MRYVYILKNEIGGYYTGVTSDLKRRDKEHNQGEGQFSSKFGPWKLKTFVGFRDARKAIEFERYLKSGSGREFARRRL